MEQAKSAIKNFTSKSGHHDTTVHENVAPSVQHETVKPTRHENVTTAVDKEIHQDHYHRTVQPVHDREVLPEKHTAQLGDVQHREFDHRDHEGSKRALATDQAKFKDEKVVHDTKHTQSAAPTAGGEHVHHHIHETIQPVVHKETIQPHVVHTTVPVHETHHKAAQHHTSTTLPAVSMDEFKAKGGHLGGREERYDAFQGEPKNLSGVLGSHNSIGKRDSHQTQGDVPRGALGTAEGHGHGHGHNHAGTTGTVGHEVKPSTGNLDRREGDVRHPANTATGTTGTGVAGAHAVQSGKPSLIDKINPMKDADGDGKKGFMK